MIWYYLFSILLTAVLIGGYVGYLVWKDEDWLDIITDKERRLIAIKLMVLAWLSVAVITCRPLYETFDCSNYARSLGTTGTYSWWYKDCNLEPTKNGLIPKSRLRGSTNDGSAGDHDGN